MTMTEPPQPTQKTGRTGIARFAPLMALAAVMALVVAMGWHRYLSFETIGMNHDWLKQTIARQLALALLAYGLLYIAVVALSLPGGAVMTLAGGLLFGWQLSAPVTIIAATIGATIVFLIARSSLGASLAAIAGPWLDRLRAGFQDNALSYLLFLRLVPAFPFVIVNVAPAILGVPLRTYVIGTALGIVPGTVAFSIAGTGLASVMDAQTAIYKACLAGKAANPGQACAFHIDTSQLITRELVIAFVAMGVVSLIPVGIKAWSKRRAEA